MIFKKLNETFQPKNAIDVGEKYIQISSLTLIKTSYVITVSLKINKRWKNWKLLPRQAEFLTNILMNSNGSRLL